MRLGKEAATTPAAAPCRRLEVLPTGRSRSPALASAAPLQGHEHQPRDRDGRPCTPVVPHDAPRGQRAARGGAPLLVVVGRCSRTARMPLAAGHSHGCPQAARPAPCSPPLFPLSQYAKLRRTCPVSKAKLFDGR